MKRKKLEIRIENKNSKNISNIFFLNKNTREKIMKLEISKKIVVNNIEFENEEIAEKYILSEIFNNNSIEELLQNPEINFQFISLFNKYRKKNENEKIVNPRNNSVKEYSNIGKPNMKIIQEILRKINFSILRNSIEWPVYKFTNLENSEIFIIRNTEKVFNLFYQIQENIENLENFFSKYSYIPRENSWKKEE